VQRLSELEAKAKDVARTRSDGPDYEASVDSEKFKAWATSVLNILHPVFGEDDVHYQNFKDHYQIFLGYFSDFSDSRGIFQSAKEDYEGGYLFNFRGLVQAEVFDDALDQARELLSQNTSTLRVLWPEWCSKLR